MGTDVQKRKARIPLGGERRRGGLEDTYGGTSLGRERRSETLDYGLGTSHKRREELAHFCRHDRQAS